MDILRNEQASLFTRAQYADSIKDLIKYLWNISVQLEARGFANVKLKTYFNPCTKFVMDKR